MKLHLSAMVDLSSEANRVHFIENYELLREIIENFEENFKVLRVRAFLAFFLAACYHWCQGLAKL